MNLSAAITEQAGKSKKQHRFHRDGDAERMPGIREPSTRTSGTNGRDRVVPISEPIKYILFAYIPPRDFHGANLELDYRLYKISYRLYFFSK
ncbi:hypothetical protein Q31b_26390 [Novipirellula aureliae]|uniref:Uncharacterized protein n=1 Tax=Novipirellula aureliae TaxID=2527966 RepID=A0A5C6DWS6_9BACT|nr:hypothetical protein Q31b_26390 [Novipirellula aureliae]